MIKVSQQCKITLTTTLLDKTAPLTPLAIIFYRANVFPFIPNLSVSIFPQVQFLNEVFWESSFQEQILGFGYRETRADFEHSKTKPKLQSISILI